MTVQFENDYQQKIMQQSFDAPTTLATEQDVLRWRAAWMSALSSWHSPYKALVDCAHELGAKVVAEGVERVDEFRAMADLGVDLGQGFYFGQPTERPMAVDVRLVRPRAELV